MYGIQTLRKKIKNLGQDMKKIPITLYSNFIRIGKNSVTIFWRTTHRRLLLFGIQTQVIAQYNGIDF